MEKQEEHSFLKEMLTPEFLKQFKNSSDLNNFIDQLFTKGVEQMLEGELDGHLGYAKQSPEGIHSGNSLNGKTNKKIKTEREEFDIAVRRDRNRIHTLVAEWQSRLAFTDIFCSLDGWHRF